MDATTAYTNTAFIPDGESYIGRWTAAAAAFRGRVPPQTLRYGPGPREAVDLFRPQGRAKGLLVFVHGGYWLEGDRHMWSHLAKGPLAAGWAVAVAGYDLCPGIDIPGIVGQVACAVDLAAEAVPGPVHLTGHSAGGHLAARLGCADVPLRARGRVARIVPISAVGDLAPLMFTAMNAELRIDAITALTASPIRRPPPPCPVTVWVGEHERPVFLDQARRLSQAWGCGLVIDAGQNHFSVIAGLEDADSPLTRAVLGR